MTGEWVIEQNCVRIPRCYANTHADDSNGDSQVSYQQAGVDPENFSSLGEGSRKEYVCKGIQGLILVIFQLM